MNNKLHNPFLFAYVFGDPPSGPRVTHDLTDVTARDPCPPPPPPSGTVISAACLQPR